jgi:hypothetical protein
MIIEIGIIIKPNIFGKHDFLESSPIWYGNPIGTTRFQFTLYKGTVVNLAYAIKLLPHPMTSLVSINSRGTNSFAYFIFWIIY